MDIVADTLSKLKNSISRKAARVDVKKAGLIGDILSVMKKEGYIIDFKDSSESKYSYTVSLKYVNGKPAVMGFKRISKLSRRVYSSVDSLPRVFNNFGIALITTSKGVLTDKEARSLGVGGEVLCYIW